MNDEVATFPFPSSVDFVFLICSSNFKSTCVCPAHRPENENRYKNMFRCGSITITATCSMALHLRFFWIMFFFSFYYRSFPLKTKTLLHDYVYYISISLSGLWLYTNQNYTSVYPFYVCALSQRFCETESLACPRSTGCSRKEVIKYRVLIKYCIFP